MQFHWRIIYCFLIGILSCVGLAGQISGSIYYTETYSTDSLYKHWDASMRELMPDEKSEYKEMLFNSEASIYRVHTATARDQVSMSSDDGSYMITFSGSNNPSEEFYKDYLDNKKIYRKNIMGRPFRIVDSLESYRWKITDEKLMYLGFICYKAVIEKPDFFLVAWYTPQIPTLAGPANYHGLPGAILMLSKNDGEFEIKATEIQLRDLKKNELSKPVKGKEMSLEEFEALKAEKEQERKLHYGSRKR